MAEEPHPAGPMAGGAELGVISQIRASASPKKFSCESDACGELSALPKPGSETLEEIRDLLTVSNSKLDTLIAGQGGGGTELVDIRNELTHLRYMFHIRQWETGALLTLPFPDFPDSGDPIP